MEQPLMKALRELPKALFPTLLITFLTTLFAFLNHILGIFLPKLTMSQSTAILLLRCSIAAIGILTILLILFYQALKNSISDNIREAIIKMSTSTKILFDSTMDYINYMKNTCNNMKNRDEKDNRINYYKIHCEKMNEFKNIFNNNFIIFDEKIKKEIENFRFKIENSVINMDSLNREFKFNNTLANREDEVIKSLEISYHNLENSFRKILS